ncbi:MAG: cytochrome c biogenesis protein ResB [Verrucomicrobiota bacterium]
MMEPTTGYERKPGAAKPSWPLRIYRFFSSLGLATILLLILGLLTWFATLEQIDNGLYPTLNKYFHWREPFVLPELYGKTIPLPLPGGYWTGALLLVNLTLGGIIHIRKGWKQIGNLIAHAGIILMLVAGGVAHHFSERGNMAVREGEASNVAEAYFEYVVEVAEVKEGKQTDFHVIRGKWLTDLTGARTRVFHFPDLPFGLRVGGYLENTVPASIRDFAPQRGEESRDGYFLLEKELEKAAEANLAGCHVMVMPKDGSPTSAFLVAGASFHPQTVTVGGRTFTVDMRKRSWAMPFTVRLDNFTAEFHPGTMRPRKFVSEITRTENGSEAKKTIRMNEPMRYEGLTFFQASYGPQGAGPGEKLFSVFEVVKNPADKWPEYSLYIVAFGMLVTFAIKLGGFILASTRKSRSND